MVQLALQRLPFIVNSDGTELLIAKKFGLGVITVEPNYQPRFRAQATDTTAKLTILAVQRSDAGTYRLNVLPTGLGSIFVTVILDVSFPPSITEISGNQTVTEGGNVTLTCLADGKPTPNITWARLSDNRIVNTTLTDIRKKDAGSYKCIADNGIGNPAMAVVRIVVQYPVEAKGFGKNETLIQGGRKTLSCPVRGIPKPNITWYRGSEVIGRPIFFGEKLEVRDTGCYTCVASNSLGTPINITQCLKFESFTASTTPSRAQGGPPWIVIGIVAGFTVFVAKW
ncbi:neurotrimin-like [Acropora muricata]|uniref:neurotrimin-like n=1 Tax=Acropora muricata TaxID=159855 RepID=UPI0034E46B85